MLISKTKSWKIAAPAIAKREASKIIAFTIFIIPFQKTGYFRGE
ncbi:MAG: hypothetical protein PHG00_17985 [Methylococcales bacterium]|nr:hypothetical protein [Methylococcales bacterium]